LDDATLDALEVIVLFGSTVTLGTSGLEREPPTSGLTVGMYRVLVLTLTHEGWRVGELARWIGISPQRMSQHLRRLDERGLVRLERDADDRRRVQVYPTDQARAIWAAVRRERRARLAALLGDLEIGRTTERDLERLAAALTPR
jgi:DNA-binding MarR family transcriptional regulator